MIKKVKKKLYPYIQERVDKAIRKDHLTKMGEYSDDDVFIVGYPKSGNTWMQNLMSSLVYGIDGKLLPDALTKELIPDVHYKKFYKRFREPSIFKSHDLPKPEFKHVIYITRDPRDVMSSYHAMQSKFIENCTMEDMVLNGKHVFPSTWHEHSKQWLKNPHGSRIMRLRYEDLLEDTASGLKQICEFIGIERTDEQIDRAVQGNSFGNMQKKEETFGVESFPTNIDGSKENSARFFRKGQAGSYKNDMPEHLIQHIEAECLFEMKALGYAIE